MKWWEIRDSNKNTGVQAGMMQSSELENREIWYGRAAEHTAIVGCLSGLDCR